MSTSPKSQQPAQPVRPVAPIVTPVKRPAKAVQVKKEQTFLFDKDNYIWMIAGIALIFIGFMLMSGGKSPDPTKFNYDEIYSFRRITLAPIVVLLGFAIEVYAIMKKPKEELHIIKEI
jgi:hypothetical protein